MCRDLASPDGAHILLPFRFFGYDFGCINSYVDWHYRDFISLTVSLSFQQPHLLRLRQFLVLLWLLLL